MKVKITEQTYKDFNDRALYLLRSLQNRELTICEEIERITGLECSTIEEIAQKKNFLMGSVYVVKNNEVSYLISELSRVRDEKNNIESILEEQDEQDLDYDTYKAYAERLPALNEEIDNLNSKLGGIDKKIDETNRELQIAEGSLKRLKREKRKYKKELKQNLKLQKKVKDTIVGVNNSYSRSGKVSVKSLEKIPFIKNK